MSQQPNQNDNENLPAVPQSGAGDEPFSIRQYVFASRQRNISQNWPFEEKHLQLCLKNGLEEKDLLPPFELGKTSHDEPLKGCFKMKEADSGIVEAPKDTDNECNYKVIHHPSSHQEGNHSNQYICSNNSAILSQPEDTCPVLPPSSNTVKYNRKKRKGKCKKRSMVDILAVAPHCALEESDEMNEICHAETVTEGRHQMLPSENISKGEAVDEDSCKKGGSEDHVMV